MRRLVENDLGRPRPDHGYDLHCTMFSATDITTCIWQ